MAYKTISNHMDALGLAKLATTSWLFVIFGEHQAMAQLIAKRVLISPLINKDLPVRHPSPRSWQFCVRDPESPKVTKTRHPLHRCALKPTLSRGANPCLLSLLTSDGDDRRGGPRQMSVDAPQKPHHPVKTL
jgi:hypothetical protein